MCGLRYPVTIDRSVIILELNDRIMKPILSKPAMDMVGNLSAHQVNNIIFISVIFLALFFLQYVCVSILFCKPPLLCMSCVG